MLELSELYVLTFNIGMFCPPKALPSGGEATRTMDRPGAFLYILVTPKYFLPQKSRGNLPHWPALRTQVGISRGQRSTMSGCEQSQQTTQLIDHLVGNGDQPWREGEPERVGDFEIDQQLELG
jgi:hypothetical protein